LRGEGCLIGGFHGKNAGGSRGGKGKLNEVAVTLHGVWGLGLTGEIRRE